MKAFWAIGCCLFLQALCCRGQEYLFVRYTQKDGLINGRVRFMYQDSKGRLYVSTFGGLSVYDGSRFVNYSTENGLSASLVNDIVEMGEDSFWIVPNAPAMNVMVHGTIRDLRTEDHFYPVTNQIIRCGNGEIYSIADDGLFKFDGRRFLKVPMIDASGREAGPYLIAAVESGRKLFILTDRYLGSYPGVSSLLVYDLDTRRLLTAGKPEAYLAITRSPDGRVLVGTNNGVREINPDELKKGVLALRPPPAPYTAAVRSRGLVLQFDREKNLWLSDGSDVERIDSAGILENVRPRGGLPAGAVNSFFEDRERNIWIANSQNGIGRLVRNIRFYGSGMAGMNPGDLAADLSTDSVWFYDRAKGEILLQSPQDSQRFFTHDPLPLNGHIIVGKKAWLTGDDAIYQLQLNAATHRFRAVPVVRTAFGFDGRTCFDRAGRLVVATFSLVVVGDDRVWQRPCPGLCDQAAIDDQNRIWAVTRADSLLQLELDMAPGRTDIRVIAAWGGLPARSPRSICIDRRGRIWVGTRDHGLYCLEIDGQKIRSWRRLTIDDGLSENFVRYLYCDPAGAVWAATPSGLDKITTVRDGFSVTNVMAGQGPGVLKIRQSADRTLWADADGGLLRISPDPAPSNEYHPPVLFSQVLVGGEPVTGEGGDPLTLSHDRNAISFNVGAPSFTDENQTRFSYLLEGGSETAWSPPSRQSAINFVNLPAGKYTLRVKAKFLSGAYPDAIGSYPFVIRPPWWQTTIFRSAALVVLLVLIGRGLRRYTFNRLKAQRIILERQRAIEKERTRIATDMHDDLGAGLSRIKFLSDTIGIKQQQRLSIDEEIDGIREYSKEMIDKMGEIVWALNQKHDLLSDLLSYTRSYAAGYLMQAAIHARIEAPEEFPFTVVSGEFRRNVYLAVKEALHNIVKHSQAQEVMIRIEAGKDLVITLKDDGIGFDRARIRPYANGLVNMERRIRELGGSLLVESGPQGTEVTIVVPV